MYVLKVEKLLRNIINIVDCVAAPHVEGALEAELGGDGGARAEGHGRRGVSHHAEAERVALEAEFDIACRARFGLGRFQHGNGEKICISKASLHFRCKILRIR